LVNWITLTVFRIVPGNYPAYSLPMREKVCKTCLLEHDEEIHEATVSLHLWLRERLQRMLADPIPEDLSSAA
jgi:hypothetical protein